MLALLMVYQKLGKKTRPLNFKHISALGRRCGPVPARNSRRLPRQFFPTMAEWAEMLPRCSFENTKGRMDRMIDSFEGTGVDAVIINAAGCGHTSNNTVISSKMTEYRERQEFAANVKDVQEFLDTAGLTANFPADQPLTLVYQDACHLLHGQKISLQPRQLLRQIPE